MPDIRELRELLQPSSTDAGDGKFSLLIGIRRFSYTFFFFCEAISAIILAVQMIITYCKKLKYKRKIVLVTNGNGVMNDFGLDGIISKVREDSIDLVVMLVFPYYACVACVI